MICGRRRAGTGDRDRGFTVIEVMITSALLLVVLAMVLPQLSSSINNFDNARVRSDATDAAQLAMDQIQHDVVSSNVLYQEASGVIHLQVYSGSSTTVVTTVPSSICVEYRVAGTTLQRQTKPPGSGIAWAGIWNTVMTGVVNNSQPGSPAVFTISQNRSLVMTLWVNADTRTVNPAKASLYTTTVTGRAIPDNPSFSGAGAAC